MRAAEIEAAQRRGMERSTRICVECAHFGGGIYPERTLMCGRARAFSLVTGHGPGVARSCAAERSAFWYFFFGPSICGPDGIYFERREPPRPPVGCGAKFRG